MSDVASKAKSDTALPTRRRTSFTAKGMMFFIQTCQEKRSMQYKRAKSYMNQMDKLMHSADNIDAVKSLLDQIIICVDEAKQHHLSFVSLDIPQDEKEKQDKYFEQKEKCFSSFIDDVKGWLSNAGHSYELPIKPPDNQTDIGPEDSVSNKGSAARSKAGSKLSRISSSASAKILAQAERAALQERMAALKQKHTLEAQEEQIRLEQEELRKKREHLRREKEQLALEAELKVTNAKLEVLQVSSKCGSKVSRCASQTSDGMNSYLKRSEIQGTYELNPNAERYVPTNKSFEPTSSRLLNSVPVGAQPKHVVKQIPIPNVISVFQRQGTQSLGSQDVCDDNQPTNSPDILNIMQRQNEITALLVQQNTASALPMRNIPVFDGDPLYFKSFLRAFENCIEDKTQNFSDCLYFLEQYTRGQPRDIVRSCQHMPSEPGYQRAKALLIEHFGSEHKISSAYMDKINNWPSIKPEDVNALQSFALFLRGCSNIVHHIKYMKELDMPANLRTILMKLPYKLREKWRNVACDILEQTGSRAVYVDFVNFIEKQVKIVSDPLFGNINDVSPASYTKLSMQVKQKRKSGTFATSINAPKDGHKEMENLTAHSNQLKCMFCYLTNHTLEKCFQFRRKTQQDKIQFLKEKGVCFGCLKHGHTSKDCRGRLDCEVCHRKHPSVLHVEKEDTTRITSKETVSTVSGKQQTCGHIGAGEEDIAVFPIVAVQVKSRKSNKVVHTYAFLDPGSSGTFCTTSMAERLGVSGKNCNVVLRTMGQTKTISTTIVTGLEVSGFDTDDFIELPSVLTQTKMPVSKINVPCQDDVAKWAYLSSIRLHEVDADVDLLIGTDSPKVLEPWELINSQCGGPYAVRTRVGWVINGPLRAGNSEGTGVKSGCIVVTANHISVEHLESMLMQQYNHDFTERTSDEQLEMSREDIKFMKIVESTTVLNNEHYYIDLPFRIDDPVLPNNRCIALQRLQSLKRRFNRNSSFKAQYVDFLNNMLEQGYAEKVPTNEPTLEQGKVWYIPHHGVHHPTKGNLRVVFDCGCTYKGTSLNSQLLQGPDFTNTLIGVLLRFREEPIAVMADINAMFHQVRVPYKHVNFLRFLWWPNGDTTAEPEEYRMCVHLFGAVSSPSCSNYALRRTAEDNALQYSPDVLRTVKTNFYVDDCLKSTVTEEDAVKLIHGLTSLCKKGGFHLQKWVTNNSNVFALIPSNIRAVGLENMDLDRDQLPVERALGMQWCVQGDTFSFRTAVQERPHTRRGILSVVSSLYDPLGFLSPFIIPAKLLLQELCRMNFKWDEPVPCDVSEHWSEWLSELQHMSGFKVERCIKPKNFGTQLKAELHHFSDASQIGYGTVSYLRLESTDNVHVSFITGKARVAPLKQLTIPRLELAAAVLAVRVNTMLLKELQLPLQRSFFWTDSTTVLKYIFNETKRFHTYVANRVSTIRESTDKDQWRYVNTKDNPADEASRGLRAQEFGKGKWLKGPDFLHLPPTRWPKLDLDASSIPSDDAEVKRELKVNAVTIHSDNPLSQLIHYFSSWRKLKTSVAWLLELKERLLLLSRKRKEYVVNQNENVEKEIKKFKAALGKSNLTPERLEEAEKAIIQFAQNQRFSTEISSLKHDPKTVFKDSPLYRLDPFIEDGILRVGGRLFKSVLPWEVKHPVILSKDLHVSQLILRYIHCQLGHAGRNYMLHRLRQKYWIINANSAARKILSQCTVCRRYRGKLGEQKMSDLPEERVVPDNAPFTNAGVDYFGPLEVRRGRTVLKRYGVIFTCMSSRAVHLEVAHSLDTDSCINAVRRFICRRGPVTSIRSDNGTNFVGAKKELRQALAALNHSKIERTFVQEGMTWSFNTPAASHQGGVWERLIRSVRSVLTSVIGHQLLDEEGLQTLFCEVEAILNDRPITKASEDPNDLEALTPNHILLLKGKPILPLGLFEKSDLYIKRRWRQVQYVAELFWKRWTAEYLLVMQERQKWTKQKRNFIPGDIVVIADATAPRGSWMMGRVLSAIADSRGLVRSVKVQTKISVLDRPITKLCLLLEANN